MDDTHDPEFDSDEDALWSDEDDEVGDFDVDENFGDPEEMPETMEAATLLKKKQWRESQQKKGDVPSSIPHLELPAGVKGGGTSGEAGGLEEEVFGWRRLPRPVVKSGFLSQAEQTFTLGPDLTSSNTLNKPLFLVPISPIDACKYDPKFFTADIESIFIPNAKRDMERARASLERNIRREEELRKQIPTDDLLLFGEVCERVFARQTTIQLPLLIIYHTSSIIRHLPLTIHHSPHHHHH